MDEDASPGSRGRKMMMRKLKLYLWWKSQLAERKQSGKGPIALLDSSSNRINNLFSEEAAGETTAALKKKDQERAQRTQSRRRMRGGAPAVAASGSGTHSEPPVVPKVEPKEFALREVQSEADHFARLCVSLPLPFETSADGFSLAWNRRAIPCLPAMSLTSSMTV